MPAPQQIQTTNSADTLPCRHSFDSASVEATKQILTSLAQSSPQLLSNAGIDDSDWAPLLRAAIESMRGTNAATGVDKKRFIEAVLQHAQHSGHIRSWSFVGSSNRQDYRVELVDGAPVAIEAKGCPDGNNTTIWDRPAWAEEFIVWSLCPQSLAHDPGEGVWSGIATRLMPKIVAEHKVVNAFIFWDGRCGSKLRPCPKTFGVSNGLRDIATNIPGQPGREDWVPPPCIYLFPKSWPTVPHNQHPPVHTMSSSKFAKALLNAFNVPDADQPSYVHTASVEAKGTTEGTQILISTVSRGWPDRQERLYQGRWKDVRREA